MENNFNISFDEEDIKDIKISFPKEDDDIIEILLVTPLIKFGILENEVEKKEGEITVKCKPEKGETALNIMTRNLYSIFKVCQLPGKLEDNLKKLPEYLDSVKDKNYKELFVMLDDF